MIVVQTPLRISFFGGGTDFENFYSRRGGAVFSTAIDKYVYVIIKERFDEAIYVNYSKKETVDDCKKIGHDLVRETIKSVDMDDGIELTTLADIPSEGSGLGPSSSVTIGLLQALNTYNSEIKTAEDLAQEACKIEIDILGKSKCQ